MLDRGILVPHPREDYDLLEERLLESLELRMPRILACGHFHLNADEEAELIAAGEEIEDEDGDADICEDCGRRVRDGRYGAGTGSRRWDIKLYAANGLMRAGAWGAVWREMERVDVEICPWLGEELKRELETAREAEEQEEVLRHATDEENVIYTQQEDDTRNKEARQEDNERMREIYGDDAQAYMDVPKPTLSPTPSPQHADLSKIPGDSLSHELPLSTLLANYVTVLAQDPRNVVIAFLSLLVLALAIMSQNTPQYSRTVPSPLDDVAHVSSAASYVSDAVPKLLSSASNTVYPSPLSTESAMTGTDSEVPTMDTERIDITASATRNIEEQFEMD